MEEIADTLVFYGTALIYPLVTGPLAAWALVLAARRGGRWLVLLYWPALIMLHAAGFYLLLRTLGDFMIGPGFMSCLVTPVFAVGTALGLRIVARRLSPESWADPRRRRWLLVGAFLLPLLQAVTVIALVLLAPSR
jgi:hypothetical protein